MRFSTRSMFLAICCTSFGLLRIVSAAEDASDWLQFRGPRGLGVGTTKGLPDKWSLKENLQWKTDLPGAGASSPVLAGKRIYLTCYSGYGVPGQRQGEMADLKRWLVCLDRATGKEMWKKEVPSKLPEQKSIRESHGYATSTVAVDDKCIYAFFGISGAFAFDLDGKQLWHADVGSRLNGWGSSASPILFKDLVIINASVESDSLVALDRESGKEKWRAKGISESWGTPILVEADGKTELVISINGKILAFNPENGQKLWTCTSDINTYMSPSVTALGDVVFCVAGRTNGSCAVRAGGSGDVTKTHRLWTSRKGTNVPSPIAHDGLLYWAHDSQGTAFCANGKTGEILYQERLAGAGQIYASAVLADGKIYHTTRDGRTFVLKAGPKFELLEVNNLRDGSLFNASPAVADGKIYLRSDKCLYCVGKE